MELRRQRKITVHRIALAGLVLSLGVLILLSTIMLAASGVMESSVRMAPEEIVHHTAMDIDMISLETPDGITEELLDEYEHTAGIIYLTFDDGPGEYTATLLDVLKKYDVKATFFVTGRGADEMIRREYEEGHTVALHTWSHNYASVYNSIDSYFNDLNMVAERVKNITGKDAKLIRFPGGSSNTVSAKYDGGIHIMSKLVNLVEERGYRYFDWNISSGDAEARITTAEQVYSNVVSHLRPGANVVLQHDIKGFSVAAVENIIQYGINNGYGFSRLEYDSPDMHHGVNN